MKFKIGSFGAISQKFRVAACGTKVGGKFKRRGVSPNASSSAVPRITWLMRMTRDSVRLNLCGEYVPVGTAKYFNVA